MDRHTCRKVIVRTLFQIDFGKVEQLTDEQLEMMITYAIDPTIEPVLPIDWDSYACTVDNLLYIKERINDIFQNHEKIDSIISSTLQNYSLERLNYVDRAIVRLAVSELLEAKLAKDIIINEALELTKEYSNLDDEKQVKFNNRLLDNICQGMKNE